MINYVRTYEDRFKSDKDLLDHVTKDIDDIILKEAIVNDVHIPIYRINSGSDPFLLTVREHNKLDIPIGITKAQLTATGSF